MDLELSSDQVMLDDTAKAMFTGRPRDVAVDTELLARLDADGYLDVLRSAGPIEAALVAERAAEAVVCGPVVARVLVAPLAGAHDLPATVGLVAGPSSLVRYAGHCEAYLVLDGDEARVASADDVEVSPIASRTPYPMGRVRVIRGESLGEGSGDALRRAWQVGIAVETSSMALAAVNFAAQHVTDRHQFGRPIGSFQAVQHRLARSHSMAMATRWLGRRGAWFSDDEFITASAATFACMTARETYDNTHQVTGGIGITSEYGLTDWTMRLLALHAELGGAKAHSRQVARARRAATT